VSCVFASMQDRKMVREEVSWVYASMQDRKMSFEFPSTSRVAVLRNSANPTQSSHLQQRYFLGLAD
jgi:hypothetical protein